MAVEIPVQKHGVMVSAADLTAKANQYRAVKVTADFTVGLAGDGDEILAVLQNRPNLGEAAELMGEGITKAKAGGTIAVGDKITPDASGDFVTAASGKHPSGTALEAAVVDQIFTVNLNKSNVPLA